MISVELRGRLGNQMFQYAMLLSVCEKNQYHYTFNKNWLGKDIFRNINYGENEENIIYKFDEGDNKYNENVFNIKDNTLLYGYFQSEKYFNDIKNVLKNVFYIEDFGTEYNYDDFCYIHFRGGDYKHINCVPSINFYNQAKQEVLSIKNDLKFVIITDDIHLARRFFPNDIIISNEMCVDYSLLFHSKYKIISASTFSWWASYLSLENSAIIIAPDRWMNYNKNIINDDIFIPNDIRTNRFIYI